ncbi:Uncharacterized protein PECH_008990 [Penicillium ucsense]|uniref:Short-chain dehydrogenase n=1 Tax=Penicillium ucsense TaxID=2839758 RepID=A0A8J8WAT7_9EURO|nr:Uncharacterized protein PECM_001448 [Penicillium ucsense]KAF7733774.1 Uncharacterized protein PECH_008990 [Penicillium ucsense]
MSALQNQKIVIFGGSSGIGRGVAEKALMEGAIVHIASSNPDRVKDSVQDLQHQYPEGQISGHVIDLSTPEVESSLDTLLRQISPLDHIVYTAGDPLPIAPVDQITLEAIHRAGQIRFFVPLLLGKLAPRHLNPGYRSSLTLTTGAASERPFPNWSLIAGYLTGLHGMTRNLALDLKPLRVNLVSPGAVHTPMWGPDGVPAEMQEKTPLGKVGTPLEVAEAYVYLMKDTNATGSVVNTNSGSLLQ